MMGTVQKLAEKVKEGLPAAPPEAPPDGDQQAGPGGGRHVEAQTLNTIELANVLPVPTEPAVA